MSSGPKVLAKFAGPTGATGPGFVPVQFYADTTGTVTGYVEGGPGPSGVTITSVSYSSEPTDYAIEVVATENVTITLNGNTEGRTIIVKNYSTNGIVVTFEDGASPPGTIDYDSSANTACYGSSFTFVFDGVSNWSVN
jgi:hypothetical protein